LFCALIHALMHNHSSFVDAEIGVESCAGVIRL
jgi:hypothetical protein